ncbi:hypothetical protein Ptr902_08318 [Pyrenophora tritici-repentis]|nr:hypothetical protein Ptr902_08318 [Pyrenophora tritici-repentis]
MAEEMVELGFEGLDRFANKYWDRTYDRLPEVPRPGRKKRQQQRQQQYQNGQRQQYLPQDSSRHPDKGYRPSHCPSEDVIDYESDPEMYGPDRRRDSYGREEGYYETGRNDYRAPGPGFKVPNARDEYNGSRGVQVAAYAPQVQPVYEQRRPAPHRRRSSWSPPRSEQHSRRDSRHQRSDSRSRSRSSDAKHRLIATVGGALVGGLAGNQATKGGKYDTVATIAGAIIGGVGAREVSGQWDERKKRKEHGEMGRESGHGNERYNRDDRHGDDRYDGSGKYRRDDRRRP